MATRRQSWARQVLTAVSGLRSAGSLGRDAVEEANLAGREVELGADDEQAVVIDQILDDGGAVAEVAYRGADVGAHGFTEHALLVSGTDERLDVRCDTVGDRADVA